MSDDNINLELLDVDHSNTISSTEWKTFLKNAYVTHEHEAEGSGEVPPHHSLCCWPRGTSSWAR